MMPRLPAPSRTQIFSLVVATFFAFLFTLHIYSSDQRVLRKPLGIIHSRKGGDPWRRDTGEYILDPAWDVDAPPRERFYNWTLTEIEGNPDGVWRTLLAINGQFPGPMVEVNEDDTIVIDVHNRMSNSTSIHWHGFHQNGTNWMDGTVGVTNCPIPPGHSFQYKFKAEGLRGTYWYHAHYTTQRVDGLFGPLVIHSPKEVVHAEYHTDRVVMVQDYYHDLSTSLLPTYLAPDNENAEPVPNGALINGRGSIDCSKVPSSYRCTKPKDGLEVLNLPLDQSHRVRFINVGAFAEFDIELDQHAVSLVEIDGSTVKAHSFNRFRINVAQRYSVIMTAQQTDAASSSFWLRARMGEHCFVEIPENLEPEVRAIVQFIRPPAPAWPRTPQTQGWSEARELICRDMNLTEVRPMRTGGPEKADILIPLRSNFEIGAYKLSRGVFNATSWKPASTPTLLSAIEGVKSQNASFLTDDIVLSKAYDLKHQLVVNIPHRKVVDLLISNFDDGNHPFHLHGHKFWVLAQGHGYYEMANYKNVAVKESIYRDTVSIEAFGWVLIRFRADNPGMWAFHCHLAWHSEAGMLMQFLVASDKVGAWTVPEEVKQMCERKELQRGGPIPDEDFYW
ncbi:multicopper oxidase-domain-containing protein [Pyronema domesticum]|uniref:Similar to Laccase-4 acc. no. Q02081 n=1 Tax=Pyronema omphalodes (strain CBS 100304) TaxID=1076935 RepID=U4LLJ8_PYROM|nr:multicopper oxidase-domain-containing protein [Pyronema domesticum]CCX14263.1 Similar to Laccase-4; acc. no. Q02081 [Pyronema omphalodes CBS 100304]